MFRAESNFSRRRECLNILPCQRSVISETIALMKKLLLPTLAVLMAAASLLAKDKNATELKAVTNRPAASAKPAEPPMPAKNIPVVTPAAASPFKNDAEKTGYALGLTIGGQWHRGGLPPELVDLDAFGRGVKDSMSGGATLLNDADTHAAIAALMQTVSERKKQAAVKVKEDGEKFLAENKKKAGIVTLPDGLQYKILTAGKGLSPKAEDTVTVNYRGTFIDGTEFDSSYKNGQPISFPVTGVIRGWTESLQLMKPGAKWQLFIPSELAYGEAGRPGIPPSSTLVFEVELISFAPPAPPAPPQPITSDIIRVPSAEELKHGAKIETIKADQIPQEKTAPKK